MRLFRFLLLAATFFTGNGIASEECQPVPGLDQILQPGNAILLGELHGTVEGPGFLSTAVCRALGRDLQVTVGLEIPSQENASVQRFLKSSGQAEDVSQLLGSQFWSRDYQDGRSSQAMLELLQSLRKLSARSPSLEIILIDDPSAPGGRDKAMADKLSSAMATAVERLFLVLTGNLHNRLTKRGALEPMGHRLSREADGRQVISLDMGYTGGSAWVCFGAQPSDCGKQQLGGSATRSEGVELFEDAKQTSYSGRYNVGEINASPPAKASFGQKAP